jgi:thioredoxin 1
LILSITIISLLFSSCTGGGNGGASHRSASGLPQVLDFWQPNCPPCEAMEPILAQLEEEYTGRVEFHKVNIYEERDEADRFGIRYTPTFVFLNLEGERVDMLVGQQDFSTMRLKIEKLLGE